MPGIWATELGHCKWQNTKSAGAKCLGVSLTFLAAFRPTAGGGPLLESRS